MNGFWAKIIEKIKRPKNQAIYAATRPSETQIAKAQKILKFAGSPQYQDYLEHQAEEFVAAIEKSFAAAEAGNFNVLPLYVMEAKARYALLKEVDWAHSVYEKLSQIPKTITTPRDR